MFIMKNNNKRIRHDYGYGISIDVCPNCYTYNILQPPNLVFRGINHSNLSQLTDTVLLPEVSHKNQAKNYYKFFSKRYISLGPLFICGLCDIETDIFFGFDINILKEKCPKITFINYELWEEVGFHPFEESIEKVKKSLFIPDYYLKPTTEVLLSSLDIKLSTLFVAKSRDVAKKTEGKIGVSLDNILIENTKVIWQDFIEHLNLKCKRHG